MASLTKERERLKSENQMLRRVDKDRRSTENEEVKRLMEENESLQAKIDEQL